MIFSIGATTPKTDIYTFKDEKDIYIPEWSDKPIINSGTHTISIKHREYKVTSKGTLEIESILRSLCKDEWNWDRSCEHMIATFKAENDTLSPTRIWYTKDIWICQLNPQYHKEFLKSDNWDDVYTQAEYCASVWNNAFERGIHPSKRRYAYR